MGNHRGKLVVDLDGVLAGAKPEGGSYSDCPVNGPLAQRLRELKALGWTIAVHTSRNVKSFDNNLGRIIAETIPIVIDWLIKHDVPFDEVVPAKPWTGTVGCYVDDRAVSPQDFMALTTGELLARARGAFYNPAKPLWRDENDQPWIVIDVRKNASALFSEVLVRTIKEHRERGSRALLILGEQQVPAPGLDEELKRAGVRWVREGTLTPLEKIIGATRRELTLNNEASESTAFQLVELHPSRSDHLASRHFNSVVMHHGRVVKSSDSHEAKISFEQQWLEQAKLACASVVIDGVEGRPNGFGYVMNYASGGSLADHLLRASDESAWFVVDELERLWIGLGSHDPSKVTYVTNKLWQNRAELQEEHHKLIVGKSATRLRDLGKVARTAGFDFNAPWSVNGTPIGSISSVVEKLIAMIPQQRNDHRGVWHGDFCPGNMVFTSTGDDAQLVLIDPRGTIDWKLVAFYGDRRYDLAKLTHALRWGYDALVAGWRDVQSSIDQNGFHVNLRLWDEDAFEKPLRLKVWDQLIARNKLRAGSAFLDGPEVTALTALQLITCSPLHRDDPERVVALIARGMQVYLEAKEQLSKLQTEDHAQHEANQ